MARALPSLTRFPQKSSCEVDEVCLDEYQVGGGVTMVERVEGLGSVRCE